jgi:hypothetical protein
MTMSILFILSKEVRPKGDKYNTVYSNLKKGETDMRKTIQFKLNDKPISLNVEGERMLLWVLRCDLGCELG